MKWGVQWVRVICPLCRCALTWVSAALHWECLNQQGIPEPQLVSPAGMMCEMCGFLRLWLFCFLFFFFLSSLPLFLHSSFPGMAQWRSVVVVGVIGQWVSSSVLAAHSPSSLPLVLPVGLKRSMVLTGKEKEKKEGGGVVLASMDFNRENVWMLKRKWVECWNISGELWVHYWNLNGAGSNGGCVSFG